MVGIIKLAQQGNQGNVIPNQLSLISDERTRSNIMTLHPAIRQDVVAIVLAARSLGIFLVVIEGNRSFARQDELYAQGRTKAGKIVTNARAGQSIHNYGLAWDAVEIKNGVAFFENTRWPQIVNLAKQRGFSWGGDFNSIRDLPHFEKRFGLNTSQMLQRYQSRTGDYIKL